MWPRARLAAAGALGADIVAGLVGPHEPLWLQGTSRRLSGSVSNGVSSGRSSLGGLIMCEAASTPSGARIIDGKAIAAEIRAEIRHSVDELKREHGTTPGLAVVLVGMRRDSQAYVRMKKQASDEVGFYSVDRSFPESVTQDELLACVCELNHDPKVHGILVQLPLPAHIDEAVVLEKIAVDKDVDGFSAVNIGNMGLRGGRRPPLALPCTPAGCIELLQRSGIQVSGKEAVVLGRSNIVGMPMSALLQSMDATVTVVHSRTKDIASHVRRAEIVVAAIGHAEMVQADWIKPGATVIDVGINSKPSVKDKRGYKLVGDVDFEGVSKVAGAITPVPGGVGPMTIAMLLKNTLNLARHSLGLTRLPLREERSTRA